MEETVPRSMLRKNAKIELLKRVPLFERCSRSELQRIARLADEVTLPAGRTLTKEGEPGREFVVLAEGRAEVRRKGRRLRELSAGDFLGEIALLADVPRTATVTTLTPVNILLMTARDFRTLLREMPSLQPKVLYALATRLPPEFQ
jgi:CRP/FNR family transcriptional regulator, cyclic AMP receptor protein